jgi:L-alanine-DL-glutamate epimerase-like enolase superfamily enzyme
MQITDVEAIPVEIDVKPIEEEYGIGPYVTGYWEIEQTQRILVKLETDGDVCGWGETAPTLSPDVATTVIEDFLGPSLIGRSPWEIRPFGSSFTFPAEEMPSKISHVNLDAFLGGVEVAMWDAYGKALGEPIHRLLGGKCRDRIECAYCVGILEPEDAREHARWAVEEGFSALKTKGGRDVAADVERMVAMHDEVGEDLALRLDPNQTLSLEEATRLGSRLEDAGVYLQYFEQPIRTSMVGGYRKLSHRLRQPIAVNEDMYERYNFYDLLKEDAIDVGVVDLVLAGGFTGIQRVANLAAVSGVSLAHHSSFDLGVKTAAVAHAIAALPAIDLAADSVYYSLAADVLEETIDFENGGFPVPEGPGLGVTVDESAVESFRID